MKRKTKNQPKKPQKQNSLNKKGQGNSGHLVGLSIILVLGIIIYSNSFHCSFHLDDFYNIVDNSNIHDLSDLKALWNSNQSRFLSLTSFAINYHFGEGDVWGYHFVNLVIHLVNACLAYWLTLLIFSTPTIQKRQITKDKKLIAFFIALLFVSHPLATQSVTYIVQRMASMVAMFYFLSVGLYIKARLNDTSKATQYMLFAGAIISAILAMLSKENAFTLPFAIVLIEICFFQKKKLSISLKDYRVLLASIALLAFIGLISFRYSFNLFNPILPKVGNAYTVTPFNYLFTQFSVLLKYIQLLFLPINQNLDYDYTIANGFFELRTMVSLFALYLS